MAKAVKPPTRREVKARATRVRILEAAETLFVRDGYATTTISAIAAAADVAVQTVYAVFENKRTILIDLFAYRVRGDAEQVELAERAEWRAMEAEPDPAQQIAMLARLVARIGRSVAHLYGVMAAASGAEADIAAVFQRQQDARYADQSRIISLLAKKGALRDGLTAARATDIVWLIASPHTYRAMVGDRGWTHAFYEEWQARTLRELLLGP